jgi:nifR3 family TIM-barrel protein
VPQTPTFTVGDVPVHGDTILAPLAGYSEPAFRQICREFGSAMSYTQLLDAKALVHGNDHTEQLVDFAPEEYPCVCQLFGSDPEILAAGAQRLLPLGPNVIDLNLGCSVRKILSRGAGAALLRDPSTVAEMMRALKRAVPLPVTAKIRLGWSDDRRNYLEIARVLEENGAALIAVHGRTAADTYQTAADWDAVAEIKQAVSVPVIGNGDIRRVADVARMKQHTGCDAVMVGRAAMGNPWFFAGRDLDAVPAAERYPMMRRHLRMMVARLGRRLGVLHFRKHVVKYVRGLENSRRLKRTFLACTTPETLRDLLHTLENASTFQR